MNLVAIKNEITLDPAGLGYAGKNDIEIADILNTLGILTSSKKVPLRDIQKYLVINGIWGKLKAAKSIDPIADAAFDLISSNNFTDLDLLDPASISLLNSLEASGILTAGEKETLQSMSRVFLTRAEEVLSVHPVKIHHLDVARSLGRGN